MEWPFYLPDEIWYLISLEVSNWKSFIQVCKLFLSFNKEATKLLKYKKVESFKNKYPSLTIEPDMMKHPNVWYYMSSYRDTFAKGEHKRSCPQLYDTAIQDSLSFKEAVNHLITTEFSCCGCESIAFDCLSKRQDITCSLVEEVCQLDTLSSYQNQVIINRLCKNPCLSLDDILYLGTINNPEWLYSVGISNRSSLTFKDILDYPGLEWYYDHLLRNMVLSDEEVRTLLKLSGSPSWSLPINPCLSWDQVNQYKQEGLITDDFSFLVWPSTTFEKIQENLGLSLEYEFFYLAVLLNPNLTFEQTQLLFELKLAYDSNK